MVAICIGEWTLFKLMGMLTIALITERQSHSFGFFFLNKEDSSFMLCF